MNLSTFFFVFLAKLFFGKCFFFKQNILFGETSFGKLHLAKIHLVNFIWQNFIWRNFIWRGLAAPILSLALQGSPLATPMAFWAKAKNEVTNKQHRAGLALNLVRAQIYANIDR